MNVDYVLITEDNRDDFEVVIPDAMKMGGNRVAVAAVDEKDRILGAVSYQMINYQVEIDWIFVEPEVRRKGIGSGLITEVLKALMHTGELLPVVAYFEYDEEDDELHSFFLSCENLMTSYSHDRFYVKQKEIQESNMLHGGAGAAKRFDNFFDLEEKRQKSILNMLRMDQFYSVSDYEAWKKSCVPKLCRCSFDNNELSNLIFMKKRTDGNIELSFLYAKNPKGLLELLCEITDDLEKAFPMSDLVFDAINPESERIAKHLFPDAKIVHIYEADF